MKDYGINKSIVQHFDTSSRLHRGEREAFYGFRKMFWTYLKKMHVPFYDPCCEDAMETQDTFPVRYNTTLERLEYYNGTAWVDIVSIDETTSTTTTTSTSTTTTTTAP